MNRLGYFFGDERGTVAILVAIMAVALVGLAAIVIDIGHLYENRRQMQSAADAAALAGAQKLIGGADQAAVLNEANEYAHMNDFPVDVGTTSELEMLTDPPDTEVTDTYVQVTVENHPRTFLAGILGIGSFSVRAQARAQVVYVTGADCVMPWGPVVIEPQNVWATIDGVSSQPFTWDGSDERYEGSIVVSALPPSSSGYEVRIHALNSEGYEEVFPKEGYVVVEDASVTPLKDVYFAPSSHVLPGSSVTLVVVSTVPVWAQFPWSNSAVKLTQVGGPDSNLAYTYSDTFSAPSITAMVERYPIDICTQTQGNKCTSGSTITNAAVLVVRKLNYPLSDTQVAPPVIGAGAASPVNVWVKLRHFQYSETYTLKIASQEGDPESGNFLALDFSEIWHPPSYTEDHGWGTPGGNDYRNNIAGVGCQGKWVHVGDILSTETGNLIGPTKQGMDDRLGTGPLLPFSWYETYKPASHPQLLLVPIVERIERNNGKKEVVVRTIAAFWLVTRPSTSNNMNAQGVFIADHIEAGSFSDTPPPDGIYVETARLVPPSY